MIRVFNQVLADSKLQWKTATYKAFCETVSRLLCFLANYGHPEWVWTELLNAAQNIKKSILIEYYDSSCTPYASKTGTSASSYKINNAILHYTDVDDFYQHNKA